MVAMVRLGPQLLGPAEDRPSPAARPRPMAGRGPGRAAASSPAAGSSSTAGSFSDRGAQLLGRGAAPRPDRRGQHRQLAEHGPAEDRSPAAARPRLSRQRPEPAGHRQLAGHGHGPAGPQPSRRPRAAPRPGRRGQHRQLAEHGPAEDQAGPPPARRPRASSSALAAIFCRAASYCRTRPDKQVTLRYRSTTPSLTVRSRGGRFCIGAPDAHLRSGLR